jgi:glycosyltransferase involved in cell wall biosynthesis
MNVAPADPSSHDASLPVSVVIPNYNSASLLLECVASINESDPPREIIVVDDGSTDESAEIARSLADRWPNIRVFMRKVNGGPAAAREDGIRLAAEEHLAFVDADDYLEAGALRSAYEMLRTADADICIWQLWRVSAACEWPYISLEGIPFPISGIAATRLTLGAWEIHPLGVARKAIWVNAYSELSETYPNADELLTRLALLNAETVVCCEKKYFYRLHGGSHSQEVHPRRLGILHSHTWLLRFGRKVGVDRQEAIFRFSVRESLRLFNMRHELGTAETLVSLRAFLRDLSKEVSFGKLLRRCPKHLLAMLAMRLWLPIAQCLKSSQRRRADSRWLTRP